MEASAQSTEPHQPGLGEGFKKNKDLFKSLVRSVFEWVSERLSIHEITYLSVESNLGTTFFLPYFENAKRV